MVVAGLHILFILQLLPAPAVGFQRHVSVSEKLAEGGKFDDRSGVTVDGQSGGRFDDKAVAMFDGKSDRRLDDKSVEKFHEKLGGKLDESGEIFYDMSRARVTYYDTAQPRALGETNRLGVTRYKNSVITGKNREDGKFFWPDSVNRGLAEPYPGPKDLTENVSWGWHSPSGLYGTIPVGSPLIDGSRNVYLCADDACRKFDSSGTLLWSYAPRGQLAAAPTLSDGCAPQGRLSSAAVDDISIEEEELLRPDWVKGNGSDIEHSVQFFKDFKVGDHVKVKAGASYQADGRELYSAGDQGLISGVVPNIEGKYDRAVIEWTRTGRKSAVQLDAIKNHFLRVEPKMTTTCTPMLVGSLTNGYVFAIDLANGREVWALQGSSTIAGVKGGLASKSGICVVATNRCTDRYCYRYRNQTNPLSPGNTVVRGLNCATGAEVWSYVPEAPVWNMNPVWGPNDTVIFNDQEGRVYCLELSSGSQTWKAGGEIGTYTEAAAVYDAGHNMAIALGVLQYDAKVPHRAYNTGAQYGCNPYVAPGILPRCGNAAFREGFVRGYSGTSGLLRWEKVTPHPPASAVTGMVNSPTFHTRLVVALGHNCARNSPSALWFLDPDTGHTRFTKGGPTLWSAMCAGDKEGGDIRRAMGGRATCSPGSWSAPVIDSDGNMYIGSQVGEYQMWGSASGTRSHDIVQRSSLVTGVAFQDASTAFADGIMAVATCTSLIVFQTG